MNELVFPREKIYFALCVVVSFLVYLLLVVSVVGILYILMGVLTLLFINGAFLGSVRTNAVKISKDQFPEVYHSAVKLANQMEMTVPDIYVLQAGGALNAMATRLLGRNFVIIFSDILELAYEEGEHALNFVVAHEMAHIKRKHLSLHWLIYPGLIFPFLGTAYMRSCEYTCDSFASYYVPQGAVNGLLVLASGKKLYNKVNVNAFVSQADTERGFFVWLAEILSTHPPLVKRVRAVNNGIGARSSMTQGFPAQGQY